MVKIEPGVRHQARPSPQEMRRRWQLAADVMKEQSLDCLIMQSNDWLFGQYSRWFAERRLHLHYHIVMFDRERRISVIGHGPEGGPLVGGVYGMDYIHDNIALPFTSNAAYAGGALGGEAVKLIRRNGYRAIGLLGEGILSAAFYKELIQGLPNCAITDASEWIDRAIAVKSSEELDRLGESVRLHEEILQAVPTMVYAGRMERELCADLYRAAIIRNADEHLTNICLATSKEPGPFFHIHYQNKLMEEGDILNLLFEVPSQAGYYADMHRYFALGEPDPKVEEAMDLARNLQEYMADLCRPGAVASDIYHRANQWLAARGLPGEKRNMGHGQGYGLVERPFFDKADPMPLEENMFIALHPSIHLGSVKIGPSCNYIVTKDGGRLVNRLPLELIRL